MKKFVFIDIDGTLYDKASHCVPESAKTALKMAKERGIVDLTPEKLDELIDEAWEKCPPDYSIDFRMSYNRQHKYRIN